MAKRSKIVVLCAAALLIASAVAGLAVKARRQEAARPATAVSFAMSTFVEFKFYGPGKERAIREMQRALAGIETRMSLYASGSEIDEINRNAGKAYVRVSPDTFELLSRCVGYGERSGGVFDVTIAPLAEEWGITSEHPKVPDDGTIERLRALVDYRDVLLDPRNSSVKLAREGQAIDVGGIAKGYACAEMRRVAEENGATAGYLSIGGNLMMMGEKPDGAPFRFSVRDPRGGENDYLAVIALKDTTMATSGDYERFFERDGVRYHHILDPATGRPAQTDLMSVSVVTPDGALADFLSTYLFIMGREYALAHLDSLGCGLIVIDRDRNVYVSASLADSFEPADTSGTYRFEVGP